MAKLTINETGKESLTLANGVVVPVADYDTLTTEFASSGSKGENTVVTWSDGREVWVSADGDMLIDGHADRALSDGERFTSHDGVTWTRHGGEVLVITPSAEERKQRKRAA